MRYKNKTSVIGDERIVKRFLWLPKCISNEWRWLEVARWREKTFFHFEARLLGYSPLPENKPTVNFRWSAVEWINSEERASVCSCARGGPKWRDCDKEEWVCCICKLTLPVER